MGPAEAQGPPGAAAPLAPAPATSEGPPPPCLAADERARAAKERDDRTSAIAATWRSASSPLAETRALQSLHRATLLHVLQDDWRSSDERLRLELADAVRTCAAAIESSNRPEADATRTRYLIATAADPWHHPVVKSIVRGASPDARTVVSWLQQEGCTGALERLRQLCGTGGAGEEAALALGLAVAPVPPAAPILPPHYHRRALDYLLVLLLRARRTSDCISHIKAMDVRDADALIARLAAKDKSNGRIWKHARETALLCTQVLVATYLVRPMEEGRLGPLAARLASFYVSRSDDLPPVVLKLLHSADTAGHVYAVTQAIRRQFGDSMRPFVCELYVRALTAGVNELERLKLQDEAGAAAAESSHRLADWFLSLAELLRANPAVEAECALTAFSLHPSKRYYRCVQDCSAVVHSEFKKSDELESSALETDLRLLDLKKETNDSPGKTGRQSENVPKSLVSDAVLEGEGLGLSSDLCRDLVVLLSGPRLKMLTWDLSWDQLSKHCLSYMADTEEGTKHITKELKYVHLDYTQFEIKEPEIHDVYFGIEKGYEHHLELDEDDWSVEENIEIHQNSNNSDVPIKIDIKKSKKKAPKKLTEQNEDITLKSKPSRPRKEKKSKDKLNSDKNKNVMNHLNQTNNDYLIDQMKYTFDGNRIYIQPQSTSTSTYYYDNNIPNISVPKLGLNFDNNGMQAKGKIYPLYASNIESSNVLDKHSFNSEFDGRYAGNNFYPNMHTYNVSNEQLSQNVASTAKSTSFQNHYSSNSTVLQHSNITNVSQFNDYNQPQVYQTSFESNQSTNFNSVYNHQSNLQYNDQQYYPTPNLNWSNSQPVSDYMYNETTSTSYQVTNLNSVSKNPSYGYSDNNFTSVENNSTLLNSKISTLNDLTRLRQTMLNLRQYDLPVTNEIQPTYNEHSTYSSLTGGSTTSTSTSHSILPQFQNSFKIMNNISIPDKEISHTDTNFNDPINNSSYNVNNYNYNELSPVSYENDLITRSHNTVVHDSQSSNVPFAKSEVVCNPLSTKEYKTPYSLHCPETKMSNMDNFNHGSKKIQDAILKEQNERSNQPQTTPKAVYSELTNNNHLNDKSKLPSSKNEKSNIKMELYPIKKNESKSEISRTGLSAIEHYNTYSSISKAAKECAPCASKSPKTPESKLKKVLNSDHLVLKSLLFGTPTNNMKQSVPKSGCTLKFDTLKKTTCIADSKKLVETNCTYAIDKAAIVHHQVTNTSIMDTKLISNKVLDMKAYHEVQKSISDQTNRNIPVTPDKAAIVHHQVTNSSIMDTKLISNKVLNMKAYHEVQKSISDQTNRNIPVTPDKAAIVHHQVTNSSIMDTKLISNKVLDMKAYHEVQKSISDQTNRNIPVTPDKAAIVHHQVTSSSIMDTKLISNKVLDMKVYPGVKKSLSDQTNKNVPVAPNNPLSSLDCTPIRPTVKPCENSILAREMKIINIQPENKKVSKLCTKSSYRRCVSDKTNLDSKTENNANDPCANPVYSKFINELYSSVNAGSNNSHITSMNSPKPRNAESSSKKPILNIKISNAHDFKDIQDKNLNKNQVSMDIKKMDSESDIDKLSLLKTKICKTLPKAICQDANIISKNKVSVQRKSFSMTTTLKKKLPAAQACFKSISSDNNKTATKEWMKMESDTNILRKSVSNDVIVHQNNITREPSIIVKPLITEEVIKKPNSINNILKKSVSNDDTVHKNDIQNNIKRESSIIVKPLITEEITKKPNSTSKNLTKSFSNSNSILSIPIKANIEKSTIPLIEKVPKDKIADSHVDDETFAPPTLESKKMEYTRQLLRKKIIEMKIRGEIPINTSKTIHILGLNKSKTPSPEKNITPNEHPFIKNQNKIKSCKVSIEKIDKTLCSKIYDKGKDAIEIKTAKQEIDSDVILISDSESSDVEMICSEDPIAIDNNTDPIAVDINMLPSSIDADEVLKNQSQLSVPRLSFATIPNTKAIIGKNKNRNCKISMPESLYVFSDGFSKHIKVVGIPIGDQKKLKMSCCVKLKRVQEKYEKLPKKPNKAALKLINKRNCPNKTPLEKPVERISPRIIKRAIIRNSKINNKKITEISDNSLKVDINIVKDEILEDVKQNEDSPEKDYNFTTLSAICGNDTKVENNVEEWNSGTSDGLKNVDTNCEELDKSTFENHSKLKNLIEIDESNIEVEKIDENNSLSLPCPDLITKSANCEYIVSYQEPDIIPKNCGRLSKIINVPVDCNSKEICDPTLLSNTERLGKTEFNVAKVMPPSCVRTYQNQSYSKNKRKSKLQSEQKVKKFKNNSSIDLPKATQRKKVSVTHKLEINKQKHYDRIISFSVKQLFSDAFENDEYVSKDTNLSIQEEKDFITDFKFNITDYLAKSDVKDDSRVTFYSPIFSDSETDIYKYAEQKYDELENIHNDTVPIESDADLKKQKQGKGFGDWSGRGNMKDSLRGRQEGPAAVLSDTFTTRPPLALHNFTNPRLNDNSNTNVRNTLGSNKQMSEHNNNMLQRLSKCLRINRISASIDENYCSSDKQVINYKDNTKRHLSLYSEYDGKLSNHMKILSRVPGLDNLDFLSPPPSTAIVNVVQLGQLPVTSAQQTSLTNSSEISQTTTTSSFLELTTNSEDYRTSSNEESLLPSTSESNLSEFQENETTVVTNNQSPSKTEVNKPDGMQVNDSSSIIGNQLKTPEAEIVFNNLSTSNESGELSNQQSSNVPEVSSEKPSNADCQQSTPSINYSENSPNESKESESLSENQSIIPVTSSSSFVNTSRGQALVNLLSQKIVHSPMNNQHVQMAAFTKGATINALSLQQALAQILPPPLSQASNEGVIHTANHSSVNPQVLHIVQGKNSTQTSTFNSLLVDNTQQSVVNTPGTTQVLHIVQSKSGSNPNNPGILNQSQISSTTFSGLSLVDANSQQSGNQVLHIVNAGMQNKNNTATQVLKRVNLLTSITNPQGNNEQKMVQFVCKSADGKSIQLNAQPQRGMVLRLQPIENSFSQNQKIPEGQMTTPITTVAQSNIKTPSEQLQQELKSRSVYEENYAKFIQNSSNQIVPSSPEKSMSLPKFNQAFGKSVFQENNSVPKTNENIEQIQSNPVVSLASDHQNSQDLNTVTLGQLGHISNPPLLIRKTPQTNVVQQVKTSIAPMNIQTIHGGVIYTRQIPVNIGGTQTINLITVPSSDIIDEVQLQAMQKQNQEKSTTNEQIEPQVVKLVSQDQQSNTTTVCSTESTSEDLSQSFTEQNQTNVSSHPLLTQMRIKVPMLSKGGGQMVSGTRVVRPVLQIQRNIIPGTNPAVYQQLVLTTAPTIRQPVPNTVSNVRPVRPPSTPHQESNLSSSTLEQLREFDMVLEQVKERSTVQPGNNTSTFSNPASQVTENSNEIDTSETNASQPTTPREVLYSIGPNQTVNVTYVNQKVISKSSSVLTTSYATSDSIVNISSQNSPSNQISHGLSSTISQVKAGSNTPTKINSKSIKTKPTKPMNPSTSNASKSTPVAAKTSLQKPLEDEQTTQRILYILAEYKEQVENSPDKDKPAPRRRSNPPTNPTTSTKRKKGSGSSSKKGGSGQSLQEMSPLGGDDAGHTMGSEDSSCGLSQGECTDNSIQGPENQSPQSSPQKSSKKILFQQDSDSPSTPIPQQQRNVIIADGQTITMARPGTGKTTAVLMPANYLLPMSMVKGSQQITIVTNQGPKILSVPHGEGGTTNALLVQRLISPAGLKPMLTRPGQIRHVRLPANAVQNLQAFNINHNITNQDSSWIANNSVNNAQPKLLVEYSKVGSSGDVNSDSLKTEIIDSQSIKEEDISAEKLISDEATEVSKEPADNATIDQSSNNMNDSDIQNIPEHILQTHVNKPTNNTLNLIQVHSLNADCSKLFSVQNSSNFGSLIQLSNKKNIGQTVHSSGNHGLTEDNVNLSGIQDQSSNVLIRKQTQFESQFLHSNKMNLTGDSDSNQTKISEITSHLESNLSTSSTPTQTFILSHSNSHNETQKSGNESHSSWSTNGVSSVTNDPSPSFVNYADSPHRLASNQNEHTEDVHESDGMRDLSESETTRVLRHPYSPSSSPPGPRHLYHKMFISTPVKKTFNSDMIDPSTSPMDDDKQYVQPHPKKNCIGSRLASSITSHTKNSSFTIHHHNPQVINLRHPEGKIESDISGSMSTGRNPNSQSGPSTQHSVASLRHKYAVMEHEMRLQKSLSEECEDLGVDSPSASDLFPEAELLYAASPSSQFDQSQDGCTLANTNQVSLVHASPSAIHISPIARNQDSQPMEGAEELEFARMHPNTTFHSGEIELVGDDANDAAMNISFRNSSKSTNVSTKRDVVRSVIEGIGNSSGSTSYQPSKNTANFSMVDLQRRTINVMSLQSSDDFSGAEDSMNSAESKEGVVNNKCLGEILPEEVVKRDLNLSSAESAICISSGIIQRNVAQVIRHANSDQISLSESDPNEKLCTPAASGLSQNGGSFLLETSNDTRPVESGMLKSIMLDRDGRDGLTCSSPEQHSELFWESNSNSNQSEEQTPQVPPNLLDFSSEDSNKCCKSPISCEETNSTDSSSLGGHNNHTHRPMRINSVIKSSVGPSNAAEGPILHSALLSGTSNTIDQDISKKLPITLNSVHKSDSNTSSSPEEDEARATTRRNWARSFKNSSGRRVVSPRSLSTEINIGAEIESSSSEGIPNSSKPSAVVMHSGSSTPEEGSNNSRRVSLRGPSGVKRSCHCCGGAPTNATPANLNSAPRRPRRKPPISH